MKLILGKDTIYFWKRIGLSSDRNEGFKYFKVIEDPDHIQNEETLVIFKPNICKSKGYGLEYVQQKNDNNISEKTMKKSSGCLRP